MRRQAIRPGPSGAAANAPRAARAGQRERGRESRWCGGGVRSRARYAARLVKSGSRHCRRLAALTRSRESTRWTLIRPPAAPAWMRPAPRPRGQRGQDREAQQASSRARYAGAADHARLTPPAARRAVERGRGDRRALWPCCRFRSVGAMGPPVKPRRTTTWRGQHESSGPTRQNRLFQAACRAQP